MAFGVIAVLCIRSGSEARAMRAARALGGVMETVDHRTASVSILLQVACAFVNIHLYNKAYFR